VALLPEQLLKVTHGSFSSDAAPQWKLQSVSVGQVQPLADALLIEGFRFRDRTSDAATAWITASDFSFLTTYDAKRRGDDLTGIGRDALPRRGDAERGLPMAAVRVWCLG
jgi:hypothetical protein